MKRRNSFQTRSEQQRRLIKKGVIGLIAAVAVIIGIYAAGHYLEVSRYQPEQVRGDLSMIGDPEEIVTYNDREYVRRGNQVSILFMGVDQLSQDGLGTAGNYRNGGQADFLLLLVIDSAEKTVTQIQIDRDTMAEITTLSVLGKTAGTRLAQICLSHSFGDGKAQSAELTREAVQRLLYGVDIDFYVAMNLDAIPLINDAVGGVTVTIEDDFSAFDPAMTPGSVVTLTGDQAELYVRSRMRIGEGTNAARMERQEKYLDALFDVIADKIAGDANFVGTLFDTTGDAIVSNMKRGRMINEANKAIGYEMGAKRSLEGYHDLGRDGFTQFHADEKALEDLVLDLFYTPVEDTGA